MCHGLTVTGAVQYSGLPALRDDVDIFVKRATPTSTLAVPSPMSDPPFDVYRDQLSALSQGVALWRPSPPRDTSNNPIYTNVSIGDVGYLREGAFIRMFNVMLPSNHPSNQTLGNPDPYKTLSSGPFVNILREDLNRVEEHCSRYVSAETNSENIHARTPDE